MTNVDLTNLVEVEKHIWELPKQGDMNVPARIYGDQEIIDHLLADIAAGKEWNALKQIRNVAALPGIQTAALAMPDVHPGYGFPIGGVAGFDMEKGAISLAGVGYDIIIHSCVLELYKLWCPYLGYSSNTR